MGQVRINVSTCVYTWSLLYMYKGWGVGGVKIPKGGQTVIGVKAKLQPSQTLLSGLSECCWSCTVAIASNGEAWEQGY